MIFFKPDVLDHIWDEHSVEEHEVDEVVTDPDAIREGSNKYGHKRLILIGSTESGRILQIVLEPEYIEGTQGLTVVTAFEPRDPVKNRYRRKVRGK
jgi:uncharacterized DUF497 family protein